MLWLSAAALGTAPLWSCGGDSPPPTGLIACDGPDDCPETMPMCDPQARVCVGCIASQQTCGSGLACDEETHTCVPADPDAPCHFDADCPRPGFDTIEQIFCNLDAGTCVGCLRDLDCVEPRVCIPETALCREFCTTCADDEVCDRVNRMCLPAGDAGPPDAGDAADAGPVDAGR